MNDSQLNSKFNTQNCSSNNKFLSNQNLFSVNKNYCNGNENLNSKQAYLQNNQQQFLPQRKLILPSGDAGSLNRNIFNSGKENNWSNQFVVDFEKIIRGEDKRTTLMIKNIPNKYNISVLKEELNVHYDGKYDFLYLPLDPSSNCNLGFAFINLLDPVQILLFCEVFKGKRWQKFNSLKVYI